MSVNIIFRWVLNFFEFGACFIGLVTWGKAKNSNLQKFAFALLLILLTELIGKYLSFHTELHKYNPMLYRYWGTPFQFFFFYWIYYQFFKTSKKKIIPVIMSGLYLIAWVFDEWLKITTDWKWFPSFSFGIGAIGILILLITYFLNLIKDDKIINFHKQAMFWISIGLLIGYILIIPLFIIRNSLNKSELQLFTTYWRIGIVFNCIMYTFFGISFLCTKKKL